jgi:galactokinase
VNLMGDHTDYNEGFVLPAAIDLDCLIAAAPRTDAVVTVRSLDVERPHDVVELPADGSAPPQGIAPPWGRYAAGVVRALAERGRAPVGLDAVLASTVPSGSGLASSAALEVACALALADAAELELSRRELALACQHAEQAATGVRTGIMDQLASLAGKEGCAVEIDCRTLDVEPVPIPSELALVIVHSGRARRLDESAYEQRRAACEAAARALGLRSLRDATPAKVADDPLARHVVSENARVVETARALRSGDTDELGRLFAASHASLRDDYAVSTPELDALVRVLIAAGAVGARLTGAGFGGCVVALSERRRAGAVVAEATAAYRAETGCRPTAFVCRAVAGADEVQDPAA